MYPTGNLFIPVAHGRIEAIIKEPARQPPAAAALVLHPLPTGGGTMHNKVVFRAASALTEAGVVTLRINFRGVGQSTGEFDSGRGETEDARAGLDYLKREYKDQPLIICGFSFGARVGMEVGIADPRVDYLISIGTPIDKYDSTFLMNCRKPILFVHGERDEFGDVHRLEALVKKLEKQTDAQLTIVPGADHFFLGQLEQLQLAILRWITAKLQGGKSASFNAGPSHDMS